MNSDGRVSKSRSNLTAKRDEGIVSGRITPKTNLHQLLASWPAAIPLFNKKLLACVGCEMAKFETLEDLACNYDLDLVSLIQEINSSLSNSPGLELIPSAQFILYVSDQQRSTDFYAYMLGIDPRLNVPGMTEFELGDWVLGIMPRANIARLLSIPVSDTSEQTFQGEIYLVVEDPQIFHHRAISAGARELSGLSLRDWGYQVAYCMDSDGYVIAFAKRVP